MSKRRRRRSKAKNKQAQGGQAQGSQGGQAQANGSVTSPRSPSSPPSMAARSHSHEELGTRKPTYAATAAAGLSAASPRLASSGSPSTFVGVGSPRAYSAVADARVHGGGGGGGGGFDGAAEEEDDDVSRELETRLEHRPDRELLVQRNIMKDNFDAHPRLQSAMHRLEKTRTGDRLGRLLASRSAPEELVNKNILLESGTRSTLVQVARRSLQREMEKDKLSHFLTERPTLADMAQRNLVQETMTWTRGIMQGDIPLPRNCHSMAAIQQRLFLIGGFGSVGRVSEMLIYDTDNNQWSRPVVAGMMPQDRYSHTCVAVGSQLVLFGGFSKDLNTWMNDLYVLDTDQVQPFYPNLGSKADPMQLHMWYRPEVEGTPPRRRAAHSANVIGHKVYIFAGNDGQQFFNDLHVLDTEEMRWEQPQTKGAIPSGRAAHTATVVGGDKIAVFGGGNHDGPSNTLYLLDTSTMTWSVPTLHGTAPSPRAGHTACAISDNRLLVFGGGFGDKVYNDLHVYDVEACTWSRPSDTGMLPSPRAGHTCNNIAQRLYVFGGGDTEQVFNDMHVLDTAFFRPQFSDPGDLMSPTGRGRRRMSGVSEGAGAPQEVRVTDDELELVYDKILASSQSISAAMDRTRQMITQAEGAQKLKEQAFFTMFQSVHESRAAQFEYLHRQIHDLQDLVMSELQHLRESFIVSHGHRIGRPASVEPPESTDSGDFSPRSVASPRVASAAAPVPAPGQAPLPSPSPRNGKKPARRRKKKNKNKNKPKEAEA